MSTLVGDGKNSETIDGVNGDGSDEFQLPGVSFDDAVAYGTEIGLWRRMERAICRCWIVISGMSFMQKPSQITLKI